MRWLKLGYVASAALHVAVFGGLRSMKQPEPAKTSVAVMMSHAKKKAKPKEPDEPPKPIEAPKEALRHPLAPPKPALAPPPAPAPDPIAAAHPALAALPDFGISLSGTGPGGGMAVPLGGAPQPVAAAVAHKEKVLGAVAERAPSAAGDCAEDLIKAKAQGFVQPTYTDDARAAGIEGRVRVEVSIDESGNVVSARVVSGLGHGLDESAISAARRMAFKPATRCGTSVRSTFVLSMRFVLGE